MKVESVELKFKANVLCVRRQWDSEDKCRILVDIIVRYCCLWWRGRKAVSNRGIDGMVFWIGQCEGWRCAKNLRMGKTASPPSLAHGHAVISCNRDL